MDELFVDANNSFRSILDCNMFLQGKGLKQVASDEVSFPEFFSLSVRPKSAQHGLDVSKVFTP